MPVAAFFSAAILLSWAIEPVLSSTIATRKRELPHAVVVAVLKSMVGWPNMYMKSVVIVPEPVMLMVEPVLLCALV